MVQLGVAMPRPELDQRIADRVSRMWQLGLVDEVRALERAGLREGRTASRALGYAQVLRFLAGEWTEHEAAAQTVLATRRFVRRQESWFRRDPRIRWIEAGRARPAGNHGSRTVAANDWIVLLPTETEAELPCRQPLRSLSGLPG